MVSLLILAFARVPGSWLTQVRAQLRRNSASLHSISSSRALKHNLMGVKIPGELYSIPNQTYSIWFGQSKTCNNCFTALTCAHSGRMSLQKTTWKDENKRILKPISSRALGRSGISCPTRTTVDGWNPAPPNGWVKHVETLIDNGINHLSTGAGFHNHPQYHVLLPSTESLWSELLESCSSSFSFSSYSRVHFAGLWKDGETLLSSSFSMFWS